MKILLACVCGMSTSMLAEKMKQTAQEKNIDIVVEANTVDNVTEIIKKYDVVLLGPQVGYKKESLQEVANEYRIPLEVIDPLPYGKLDGATVLDQAIALIN
ncbi:phosphotransferase system cellobiose-specific component IIB [Halobacteroides halobius DSM 5150]|uniref:Phosphotransferase system cellobiose-specific component IIB n=1 Tax=Halobacteroides halobius (strain ATCC 35273 / DSM 5150 / MD-1) TaxID=748449 RepID=L0K7C7_HALHC|nr:PTS sugar transporter subunit IIB [Halobacteroides halobius]AGB40264.1 phosphotransferase system cellobiose-specific component IIB [Halobacteroides halobius DSM 5150]